MNKAKTLILVSLVVFVFTMTYSTMVLARSSGVSGYSIDGCYHHSPTASPQVSVSISGKTIVNSNMTYTYSLTTIGGPLLRAGLDVSVTDGTLIVTDTANTQLKSGEITHTDVGTSQTNWSFNWTAPSTYGNATMYAASLSADNDGRRDADDLWNRTLVAILVTISGDANGDRIVDIFDIGTISAHWYPGPPIGPSGYDANADINNDGAIDIFDIGITSANWGQSW